MGVSSTLEPRGARRLSSQTVVDLRVALFMDPRRAVLGARFELGR